MPPPLLVHDDAEPLVAFLLWCLAIHRAEQERKRKMHRVLVQFADRLLSVLMFGHENREEVLPCYHFVDRAPNHTRDDPRGSHFD